MLKQLCAGLLVGVMAGVLWGQAASGPAEVTLPAGKDVAISEVDQGKVIHVGNSAMVTVVLTGNATTGYSWVVAKMEGESLKQTGEVAYSANKVTGVVGSGGTSSVMFRPVKVGQTKVTLEYRRPWEKDVPPAKMFEVTVVVDKIPEAGAATGPATGPATSPGTTTKKESP